MATKQEYTVKRAGFFYGVYRKELDRLRLYPEQAKYEVLAGNLFELGKEPWRKAEAAAEVVADAAASSAASVIGTPVPNWTKTNPSTRRRRRVTEST